jgi:hypothetical protein
VELAAHAEELDERAVAEQRGDLRGVRHDVRTLGSVGGSPSRPVAHQAFELVSALDQSRGGAAGPDRVLDGARRRPELGHGLGELGVVRRADRAEE